MIVPPVSIERRRRRGITLFEVVVALVVFTLTLPALVTLVQIGARRAEESAFLSRASLECRSKMAELAVGAEPLEATDWTPLPEPNWFWKAEVGSGAIDGLTEIQVSVKFDPGSNPIRVTLAQIVIDPARRGSTQDRAILMSIAESLANSGSMPPTQSDPAATDDAATNPTPSTDSAPKTTPRLPTGNGKTPADFRGARPPANVPFGMTGGNGSGRPTIPSGAGGTGGSGKGAIK